MGELENRGKKRARKRNLKHAILASVQIASLAGIMMTAPNLPSALVKLGILNVDRSTGTINRARNRYVRAGLLARDKDGRLRLTPKGLTELRRTELMHAAVTKPRRWDGRWRILIFDIPEYRKTLRPQIRRSLQTVGFIRLQDSVWIYPYDCEDFIVLLKAELKIGKDILYMIVDELEGDTRIKEQFGLL